MRNLLVETTHEQLSVACQEQGINPIRIKLQYSKAGGQKYTSCWISFRCRSELDWMCCQWHNKECSGSKPTIINFVLLNFTQILLMLYYTTLHKYYSFCVTQLLVTGSSAQIVLLLQLKQIDLMNLS